MAVDRDKLTVELMRGMADTMRKKKLASIAKKYAKGTPSGEGPGAVEGELTNEELVELQSMAGNEDAAEESTEDKEE